MHVPPRDVIYARKSTESEDRQMLSIPAQLQELREFARRYSIAVAEELTESYSAREPGRPVFSKLLRDVAEGRVNRILCWKLDRLARNPVDGGALTHYLGKGLLKEIVTPEGTYNGTSDSKFMLSVLFGAATKMTDDLSVVIRRGNKTVHERGRITGAPPLGYMKVPDTSGTCETGEVVPDPERFPLVERIWRELITGTTTVVEAWRRAEEAGLTSRATKHKPSQPVTVSGVYQLLHNRFYAGQVIRRGDVYQGEHKAMVTAAEFERVQVNLGRITAPRPQRHAFLYAGLLHCACGRVLTGETIKNRYGYLYTYYRCARRRPGYPTCYASAPREEQVTADIVAAFEQAALPEPLVAWTIEAIDLWAEQQNADALASTKALERELAEVDARLRRLTDLVVSGALADDEFVARRAEQLGRGQELKARATDPGEDARAWRHAVHEVVTAGLNLAKAFKEATDDERRQLLGRVCTNLIVTDRKVACSLRFPWTLLELERPLLSTGRGHGPNLPPPARILRSTAKNARPMDARERAFAGWWTSLLDVRTLSTSHGGVFDTSTPLTADGLSDTLKRVPIAATYPQNGAQRPRVSQNNTHHT